MWAGLKRGWEIPHSPLFFSILAFGLYVWLSTLWAIIPYNAILFASIIGILPFFCISILVFSTSHEAIKLYVAAVLLVSVALAAWALVQYFFIEGLSGTRIHNPMLNPNSLAAVLNMGALPIIAMYFYSDRRPVITATFLLSIMLVASVFVTQSRGGLVSLAFALIIMLFVVHKYKTVTWRKVIAFFAAISCIYFVAEHHGRGLRNLDFSAEAMSRASISDRLSLWESTYEIVRDNIWLGTGLGTFKYLYPAKRDYLERSGGHFAHMDPLQFWQEMGIAAIILFYLILIAILIRTIAAIRYLPANSASRFEVIAPFCALLTLAMHAHVSFHFYIPGILIPASVLLAMWFSSTERILGLQRKLVFGNVFKRFFAVTLMVILSGSVGIWLLYAATTTWLVNNAVDHFKRDEIYIGYKYIEEAGHYAPKSFFVIYDYEAQYRHALLYSAVAHIEGPMREQIYKEAHDYLDAGQKMNPLLGAFFLSRAKLYFSARDEFESEGADKAASELQKALEINPMNVAARRKLAEIYKFQEKKNEALGVLEGGLKWPQARYRSTVEYFKEIAELRLELGDKAGHDQMIADIERFTESYSLIGR
jgi:O-antigen ligase